jgi:hypothetical protein
MAIAPKLNSVLPSSAIEKAAGRNAGIDELLVANGPAEPAFLFPILARPAS